MCYLVVIFLTLFNHERLKVEANPNNSYTVEGAEWSFNRLVRIHKKLGWKNAETIQNGDLSTE